MFFINVGGEICEGLKTLDMCPKLVSLVRARSMDHDNFKSTLNECNPALRGLLKICCMVNLKIYSTLVDYKYNYDKKCTKNLTEHLTLIKFPYNPTVMHGCKLF